jgi:hypothetical protein
MAPAPARRTCAPKRAVTARTTVRTNTRAPSRSGKRRLLSLLALAGAFAGGRARADEPATPPDPWATTRGCVVVLDRFMACAANAELRGLRARWVALDPAKRLIPKDIEALVRGWTKPNERRRQCAVWTNTQGAAAHVGEGSPIAKLADDKSAACTRFAHAIDADGWLPRTIVATIPSRAPPPGASASRR